VRALDHLAGRGGLRPSRSSQLVSSSGLDSAVAAGERAMRSRVAFQASVAAPPEVAASPRAVSRHPASWYLAPHLT
jgi:hypothetical protein